MVLKYIGIFNVILNNTNTIEKAENSIKVLIIKISNENSGEKKFKKKKLLSVVLTLEIILLFC